MAILIAALSAIAFTGAALLALLRAGMAARPRPYLVAGGGRDTARPLLR